MDTCRCEDYAKAVNDINIYTIGTYHPLYPRLQVPPSWCIKWQYNKASHHDYRFTKPVVKDRDLANNICKPALQDIPTRWIPVMPGLISLKLVEESKNLKAPF